MSPLKSVNMEKLILMSLRFIVQFFLKLKTLRYFLWWWLLPQKMGYPTHISRREIGRVTYNARFFFSKGGRTTGSQLVIFIVILRENPQNKLISQKWVGIQFPGGQKFILFISISISIAQIIGDILLLILSPPPPSLSPSLSHSFSPLSLYFFFISLSQSLLFYLFISFTYYIFFLSLAWYFSSTVPTFPCA